MQKLLVALAAVFLVVLLTCIPAEAAPRRARGNQGRPTAVADTSDCSPWSFGPCVASGDKTCGRGSKNGTRTGDSCPVKEKTIGCYVKCAGAAGARGGSGRRSKAPKSECRYGRPRVSECDSATNMKTLTQTLSTGSPSTCPAVKEKQKPCGRRSRQARAAKGTGGSRRRQTTPAATTELVETATTPAGRQPKCKYAKNAQWSACDTTTNMRTKVLPLKPNNKNPTCAPTKTITKLCKKPREKVPTRRPRN